MGLHAKLVGFGRPLAGGGGPDGVFGGQHGAEGLGAPTLALSLRLKLPYPCTRQKVSMPLPLTLRLSVPCPCAWRKVSVPLPLSLTLTLTLSLPYPCTWQTVSVRDIPIPTPHA